MNYKGNCYVCDSLNEHEYQVKIINENNGQLEFVKCCSLEHAEMLKKENSNIHKSRYEDIENQRIQRLN
jgi:hypothetical protein